MRTPRVEFAPIAVAPSVGAVHERSRQSVYGLAAIGRSRRGSGNRGAGAGRAGSRAEPGQCARLRRQDRDRSGERDHGLSARLAARDFRAVVECAVPWLRRRARCEHDAAQCEPFGILLRNVRVRLRADPRRDGGGHVYGQPAGAPDRRARSARAPVCGVFPPDLLGLGLRCSRECRRGDRGDRARSGRIAARRKGPLIAAVAGRIRHRHGPGDARHAIPRRQGRADARTPEPLARLR